MMGRIMERERGAGNRTSALQRRRALLGCRAQFWSFKSVFNGPDIFSGKRTLFYRRVYFLKFKPSIAEMRWTADVVHYGTPRKRYNVKGLIWSSMHWSRSVQSQLILLRSYVRNLSGDINSFGTGPCRAFHQCMVD